MIFLRPWFLLLLCLPIIWRIWKRKIKTGNPWAKEIDAALLPYLWIDGRDTKQSRRHSFGMGLVWGLLCLAAAGPAWEKVSVPTQYQIPATVIVMDLSPAMSGKYLQQARIKAMEVLEQLHQEQVGLALYDRHGYTAIPLTPDKEIVREVLPILNPTVLPESVSNPSVGIKQAAQMMKEADLTDGRIIFITAGAFLPKQVAQAASELPYRIGILGIGSQRNGQPVPLANGGFLSDVNGNVMPIRLNPDEMKKIGKYEAATPDNSDVRRLLSATSGSVGGKVQSDDVVDIWKDMGIWFMIPAVLLASFLFRRGVFFLFLIAGFSLSAEAGLWTRPDQEAYRAMVMGKTAYHEGKYQEAFKFFGAAGGIEGLYNQGNALAFGQDIEGAIALYDKVLKKNPNHADAAYNKAYLEEQLKKQELEQNKSEQSDQEKSEQSEPSGSGKNEQNNQETSEASPDNKSETSDTNSETSLTNKQNQNAEESSQKNESSIKKTDVSIGSDGEDLSNKKEEKPAQIPMQEDRTSDIVDEDIAGQQMAEENFDQASKEILNRLPADPARVLRYRIYQQYQRQGGEL